MARTVTLCCDETKDSIIDTSREKIERLINNKSNLSDAGVLQILLALGATCLIFVESGDKFLVTPEDLPSGLLTMIEALRK